MAIIKTEGRCVFDTDRLVRGYFIAGRHKSWEKDVNGLIADVSKEELLIQFLPDVRNVTNHYRILAADVEAGAWNLRISPDLIATDEVKGVRMNETG